MLYILNFYDYSFGDCDEENLYFSSLEKLDDFMDKWDKGIAEVEDKELEKKLCHYLEAQVLEVKLDTIADSKFLYAYEADEDEEDEDALCWRKVMPKE